MQWHATSLANSARVAFARLLEFGWFVIQAGLGISRLDFEKVCSRGNWKIGNIGNQAVQATRDLYQSYDYGGHHVECVLTN